MYLKEIGIHLDDESAYCLLLSALATFKPEQIEEIADVTMSNMITATYILTEEGKVYAPLFESGVN